MPPRKSISSRAEPSSRRGKQRPEEKSPIRPVPDEPEDAGESTELPDDEGTEAWHAPPGRMSRETPEYQTGSDYEAVDGEEGEPVGEEEPPPSFSKERDIYGEDDVLPGDEDEDDFSPLEPAMRSNGTRVERTGAGGRKTGETRVAPIDDLEEEEQRPDSPDATRAGPPVKLEIVSGPDSGKVRNFRGVRMVIGRTAGCDWKLSDPSASRRHCELVVGDQGVLLRDLGSGNGTKVNGQKVAEKKLDHGDEIAVGKTVFRFIDEVAAFRKAREEAEAKEKAEAEAAAKAAEGEGEGEAEEGGEGEAEAGAEGEEGAEGAEEKPPGFDQAGIPTDARPILNARRPEAKTGLWGAFNALEQRQRIAVIAGSAVTLILVVILFALWVKKPPPPPPDPKLAKAAEKMQKARNLAREGKFEDAATLAAEAEKLVPGTDSDGLAARAKQEANAVKQLAEARKLLEAQQFDEAKVALARASFVTEAGNKEKADLSAEIESKLLAWLRGQADSAIEAKDLENATQIVSRMPAATQTQYSTKLTALREQLEAEEKEQQKLQAKQQKQQKVRAQEKRQAYVEEAFSAVARKFAGGDYQRAALECDRVVDAHRGDAAIKARAMELKRLIPQFARSFEDGQKKFKAGSLESAARPLKKARELYAQIGFEGSLGKTLDDELASAAMSAANNSYAREDYASAAIFYKEALRLRPGDDTAKEGLVRVNKRAEELYLQAYMIRDREPKEAIAKLKVVLTVTDGSGTLDKKARDLLTQMQ